MSRSIERVRAAAAEAGLTIEVFRMGASTRTAEEAARQCGCAVEQIVKSLVFEGVGSGRLYLFLVSGADRLDLEKAAALVGEKLKRADPRKVREETGFAIGGVSPLGHADAIACFADVKLQGYDLVWAAAGAHDAVFSTRPEPLLKAARATVADIAV